MMSTAKRTRLPSHWEHAATHLAMHLVSAHEHDRVSGAWHMAHLLWMYAECGGGDDATYKLVAQAITRTLNDRSMHRVAFRDQVMEQLAANRDRWAAEEAAR